MLGAAGTAWQCPVSPPCTYGHTPFYVAPPTTTSPPFPPHLQALLLSAQVLQVQGQPQPPLAAPARAAAALQQRPQQAGGGAVAPLSLQQRYGCAGRGGGVQGWLGRGLKNKSDGWLHSEAP